MESTEYDINLTGKSKAEVLELIDKYHADDNALMDAGFDLINSIANWLRTEIHTQ